MKQAPYLVALIGALVVPLNAKNRTGDQLVFQAQAAEVRKEYDKALDLYERALSQDPADSGYQLAMRRVRFQAGQYHVERGLRFRAEGKAAEALAEFEKAYAIDPSSSIAEQEIRRTPFARKEAQDRLDRMLPVPELKPLSEKPIDLKMNNEPARVLFETVGKLAGLNVVFDADLPAGGRNLSVEFNGSTVEEALDYLANVTKTFWKPLSHNAIFVTQDNTTKRRDYEDQVVKVFYLKNVTTAQELQEIATDVRSVCDIRRLFTYNTQMALIVRAEADRVALAEKVIADLDKPRAEVVIDVLVLEHNYDKTRDLGFGLADGLSSTIASSSAASSSTTDTSSSSTSSIPLSRVAHLSTGQYSVVLPSGSLQATLKNTNTRVLQAPQVRAADSTKAVLKIGNRVPTATGSYAGTTGATVSPLVNTQFQFLDVGVNVDITPKIHGVDEVSMHVDMEISNVTDHVDLGGISEPVIGQRKVTFDVRMKEGEASVLGGLMQTQQSKTMSGLPGLAGIPVLGKLFSRESTENSVSELIFVLIPHIVRAQEITETNSRGVASGSDTVVKLSYAPRRTASEPQAAQPVPSAAVSFAPARAEARPGSTITVNLEVENATGLFTAPFRIKFDPKILRLNDARAGNLLTAPLTKNIMNDIGEASVTLARLPGSGGVSGSGTLVTLVFEALAEGTAIVSVSDLSLQDSMRRQIAATYSQLTITIE